MPGKIILILLGAFLISVDSLAEEHCENIEALKFGLATLPALTSNIKLEADLGFKNYQLVGKNEKWQILIQHKNKNEVDIKHFEISSISYAKGETNEAFFETVEFENLNADITDLIKLLKGKSADLPICDNHKTYEVMKLAASIPIGPGFKTVYIIEDKYLFLVEPERNIMVLISKGKNNSSLQATKFLSKRDLSTTKPFQK